MKKFFYTTKDNLQIKAYRYGKQKPKQIIILYFRGGNNHPNHKGSMELTKEDFTNSWLNKAVNIHGCIVYATDYRGSKESDGRDDISYLDILDLQGLFDWVLKNNSDYKKIIIYGESMGVYKCLSFISRYSIYLRHVDAIIFKAGVYKLTSMEKFRPLLYHHWRTDYKFSVKQIKKRDELINPIKLKKVPLFMFHGSEDTKAPIDEMYKFVTHIGHNYSLRVFNGGDHGLFNFQNEIYESTKDIFK